MFNMLISLLLALAPFFASAKPDTGFEHLLSNSAILDTRQINIPGYPNAYNPSIIPYQEGYLLSFRFISKYPVKLKNPFRTDTSFIGVVKLDKNFNVSEESVQLLNIASYAPKFSLTAEDGRLFNVGNQIFLFFNDLPLLETKGKTAMYFGEIIEERGIFVLKERAKLLSYFHAAPVEKNWSPFVSGDKLYLIYSDRPRVILEVDLNTGYCQEVARSNFNWNWTLGEIRGGTPAYLVGDQFLTFFHSSFRDEVAKRRAYVMGAYLFDQEPPFHIRAMTPAPLGNQTDYTEANRSKVVFPGGLVIEEEKIFVTWGKDDKKIFLTTFNREKLLHSMKPPFSPD